MQEAAQPWEARFVPRETVLETVRCLLSRKPTRLKYEEVHQQQHGLQVLSSGAHPGAKCGGIRAAASTQPVNEREKRRVGGLTTSQVY